MKFLIFGVYAVCMILLVVTPTVKKKTSNKLYNEKESKGNA